jgi:glutamate N-acetyltransferase/amino-acid N-acetyltransferase
MKRLTGGITAPTGFTAAGVRAGIKKKNTDPDLALVVSSTPGPIAGMFTTNEVVAAPVIADRRRLAGGQGRAIVVNSGCANACTGAPGLRDAEEMAALVANALGIPSRQVFVGSTGVIGQRLPMPKIRAAIPELIRRARRTGGRDAARAILTTDTRAKEAAYQDRIGGRVVTVGGMCKGSGMIHPDMATMLAYVSTDAVIGRRVLQTALGDAVEASFNCISVDGDTSTNDTILCLANGCAGNAPIRTGTPDGRRFQRLLEAVCRELARAICWDGEGVTKVMELIVRGCRTERDARLVAKAISTSVLVKTAMFGEDANWGRIMAAAGRAGVRLRPHTVTLQFGDTPIVRGGMTLGARAERRIARIVRQREFTITLDLGQGKASARRWFTDLSFDYVRINASYRS